MSMLQLVLGWSIEYVTIFPNANKLRRYCTICGTLWVGEENLVELVYGMILMRRVSGTTKKLLPRPLSPESISQSDKSLSKFVDALTIRSPRFVSVHERRIACRHEFGTYTRMLDEF